MTQTRHWRGSIYRMQTPQITAVAPLATLSPRDTSNDSDAPKQRGAAPGASRPGHPFIPNRMIGTVPSSASSATLHGENKAVPSHPANARGVRPGM